MSAKDQALTDDVHAAADAFIAAVQAAKSGGLHVTLDMHDGADDDPPQIAAWIDRPLHRSRPRP